MTGEATGLDITSLQYGGSPNAIERAWYAGRSSRRQCHPKQREGDCPVHDENKAGVKRRIGDPCFKKKKHYARTRWAELDSCIPVALISRASSHFCHGTAP